MLLAEEAGLDLVEISPNAEPPVVKILDLGKLKYANQKKAAEARKNQKVIEIKEIKMRPNIDSHDYEVKMKAVRRFFDEGDKVKLTLRFRGREMAHMELGMQLLNKVREEVGADRQGRSRAEARRPPDDDGAGAALSGGFSPGILQGAMPRVLRFSRHIAIRPRSKTARQGMPWRFHLLFGLWSARKQQQARSCSHQQGVAKCPR